MKSQRGPCQLLSKEQPWENVTCRGPKTGGRPMKREFMPFNTVLSFSNCLIKMSWSTQNIYWVPVTSQAQPWDLWYLLPTAGQSCAQGLRCLTHFSGLRRRMSSGTWEGLNQCLLNEWNNETSMHLLIFPYYRYKTKTQRSYEGHITRSCWSLDSNLGSSDEKARFSLSFKLLWIFLPIFGRRGSE